MIYFKKKSVEVQNVSQRVPTKVPLEHQDIPNFPSLSAVPKGFHILGVKQFQIPWTTQGRLLADVKYACDVRYNVTVIILLAE